VRRLKGEGRPVVGQDDRAALVAALGCVGHVLVFAGDTPHEVVRRVRPDVLVKGGDYAPAEVVGREVVEGYGGRVCVTARREGLSTTAVVRAVLRGSCLGAEA
jgi:D-beta-D-heptose 7-phosphate kinase / D-beta-D-heptose 1-phosphate adenosyltransferase